MRTMPVAFRHVAIAAFFLPALHAGCMIPSTEPDAGNGSDASSTGQSGGLPDFARSPLGQPVDLADLAVGDLIIFALPGQVALVDPTSQPFCVCDWTVSPAEAGRFEPPMGCSTVYTVLAPGGAVIDVAQTCGDETAELSASINALVGAASLSNTAPTADAGPEVQVDEGDTVVLDGRGSFDAEGGALTYQWAQVGGVGAPLASANGVLASFVAPQVPVTSDVRFRLTVVDEEAAADVDEVVVRVRDVAGATGPVTALAGPDQTVFEGQTVTLDGRSSSGSGVGPLFHLWTQQFGASVPLQGSASDIATFTAPDVGEFGELLVFKLTVSQAGDSDTDDVLIAVVDPEAAQDDDSGQDDDADPNDDGLLPGGPPPAGAPVVFDGDAATGIGASVVLSLTADDDEGDELTFSISKEPCDGAVGAITQNSPDSATVTYTPAPGFRGTDSLTFVASDGAATSAPGVYTISVGDPTPFRAVIGSSNLDLIDDGTFDAWAADGVRHFGVKLGSLRAPVGSSDRLVLQRWADAVADVDGTIWVVFNWYGSVESGWLSLNELYVSNQGVSFANAPCPQSDQIWNDGVAARWVALAQLTDPASSAYMPDVAPYIDGIMLDPELYASDVLHNYTTACHCTSCFQRFFQQRGIDDPVPPPTLRAQYLQSHALAPAYDEFERIEIRDRAIAARQAMHAVNPCMKIGGTSLVRFDRSPFYVGAGQGFGVKEAPHHEFTQSTFANGYNSGVPAFRQAIAAAGLHALLYPGLWMEVVPPDAFADHYYTLATLADGAFILRLEYYGSLEPLLCFPVSEYRQAIATANAELDLFDADPNHVSPFDGDPFVPACVDTSPYAFPTGLVPLENGAPASVGIIVRDESAYYFHANAGDSISLDVVLREFGNNDPGAGWWILLAPDGGSVDEGAFTEATSPSQIRATADQTGVHTLIVRPSFVHGYHIDDASHPGAYLDVVGDQLLDTFRAHLLQPEPQLFAYVPPGVTTVGVKVSASLGEVTQVLIHDERDPVNPLFDEIIGDTAGDTVDTNLTLTLGNVAAGDGVVLEISLRNPGGAEDLKLEFTSGALPYLSQTRSGLFRAP